MLGWKNRECRYAVIRNCRHSKELVYMARGHELKGGNAGGRGYAGRRGIKRGNGTTVIA